MQEPRGSAWWQLIKRPAFTLGVLVLALSLALAACSDDDGDDADASDASEGPQLSGTINGDGSSTVFPISEAVAEEFGKIHDVDVTVGVSGTGGGFEKFCADETDFSNASRAIEDDEMQLCSDNGVEYVEFQVAYDGISIVVNPNNDWADCLTVEELNAIWKPESTVDNWNEVNADFPDESLDEQSLWGPGTDSGTFDYFTDVINGEEGASRSNYNASEDDNVLVNGVANDDNALGYFGYAYYIENESELKVLGVDEGNGCVEPTPETIADGSYSPLSRPLYVYVKQSSLAKPEVAEFMRFTLTEGRALVSEVGFVEAPDSVYDEGLAQIP
jgi:phosphate transport system substrate-binding protein